jgi:hypothetical protein
MDTVTWGVFALILTVAGGAATWLAFRRWGARAGTRWLALTLLVPAAYLTRTLQMFGRIADAVTDWAVRLVWNPTTWVGVGLAGLAVLLFLVSLKLPRRGRAAARAAGAAGATGAAPGAAGEVTAGRPAEQGPVLDSGRGKKGKGAKGADDMGLGDDLADIEAILKRRGIS